MGIGTEIKGNCISPERDVEKIVSSLVATPNDPYVVSVVLGCIGLSEEDLWVDVCCWNLLQLFRSHAQDLELRSIYAEFSKLCTKIVQTVTATLE